MRTHRATPACEDYLNSEKYEIRNWDLNAEWSIRPFIARVNRVRRENPALRTNDHLHFHETDNDMLLCYSKCTENRDNVVLVVVNLNSHHAQAGWLQLDLAELGLDEHLPYQVHDLLGSARFLWQGATNYVELDPNSAPVHLFRVRRKVRTERDFDYYL